MEFGICIQSLVPVRLEPSHKAEMSTQILFGELYRINEISGPWLRIQLAYDNYEGWIHAKQARLIDEPEFIRLTAHDAAISMDLVQLISNEQTNLMFPILLGSSLPGFENGRIAIAGENYSFEGSVVDPGKQTGTGTQNAGHETRSKIIRDAMLYLNAPYFWGGRSPFGIDCSGFVQMVYRLAGMRLLRDARQQSSQGEVISLLAEAEAGDLVFFDDEEGNINHVGLICERNRIIHCSGKVRIDALDHEGIYDEAAGQYTHKLRLIKRIL